MLTRWAERLTQAYHGQSLTVNGEPIVISSMTASDAPRTAVLTVIAGGMVGSLLQDLTRQQGARLRQLVPWDYEMGEPTVTMEGRALRMVAPWPDRLAITRIPVKHLLKHRSTDRWVLGIDEGARPVTAGVNDDTPHWLIGGTTGSGKTTAIRSAVWQLSQQDDVRLVLIDGKQGRGLGLLAGLHGVVGPVATSVEDAARALEWAVVKMDERHKLHEGGRLVVVIDELGELMVRAGLDRTMVSYVRSLVTQGREARTHVLATMQDPTSAILRDTVIQRNLGARIACRVTDYNASAAIVGGKTPRADRLLLGGDAWVVIPGRHLRLQLGWLTAEEILATATGEPLMDTWPEIVGMPGLDGSPELPAVAQTGQAQDTPLDLALALVAAARDLGRPTLMSMFEEVGLARPGSSRAARLLTLGREQLEHVRGLGADVVDAHGEPVCLWDDLIDERSGIVSDWWDTRAGRQAGEA